MASLFSKNLLIIRSSLHPYYKRPLIQSVRCLQEIGTTEPRIDPASPSSLSPLQRDKLPMITSRKLPCLTPFQTTKQAWLETLDQIDNKKLGIIDLHPSIFSNFPRLDILWSNVFWQQRYKYVNYENVKNRAEMRGGGKKPWAQKGSGRARHGSIRSPLWKKGGKAFGPRGPRSYFYMLSDSVRIRGLAAALSIKLAQNNLHIVDSLDIPNDEPEYLKELVESRSWGLSVLFVDEPDILPRNFALSLGQIKPYNCIPVYGLNVYSMLKHETLVLTLAALEKIEERILFHLHKADRRDPHFTRNEFSEV